MTIDTMASAAMRRVAESVNLSAGQHLRAMREHAEKYAMQQADCLAKEHANSIAGILKLLVGNSELNKALREALYRTADKYNVDFATAAQLLANEAHEIANFER